MLDWFSIFTKGGIVLWYFQGTALSLTPAVNSLIRTVILQVRERERDIEVDICNLPLCVCAGEGRD